MWRFGNLSQRRARPVEGVEDRVPIVSLPVCPESSTTTSRVPASRGPAPGGTNRASHIQATVDQNSREVGEAARLAQQRPLLEPGAVGEIPGADPDEGDLRRRGTRAIGFAVPCGSCEITASSYSSQSAIALPRTSASGASISRA